MANTLGSVVLQLAVDTARFQGDLGRAAAVAESRMRNIKDTATRALGAIAVAATAAGSALVYALKGAIDRADGMRDLAQASGVTVEQLSRLAFAGKQSGVELETIGRALAKLAKDGAPDANQALMQIADQFAMMPDGARKTAMAIEYFGTKLGPGLIPLLNEGSFGLAEMAKQSDAVGNTLSTSAAEGADRFNDSLGRLKSVSNGLINSLAADLLPVLNDIADAFVKTATEADNLNRASRQLTTFVKVVSDIGLSVYTTFQVIGEGLGGLAAAVVAATRGDLAGAAAVYKAHLENIVEINRAANVQLEKIWSERSAAESRATRAFAPGGHSRKPTVLDMPEAQAKKAGGTKASVFQGMDADSRRAAEATQKLIDDYYGGIEFRSAIAEDIARSSANQISIITEELERNVEAVARQNQQMTVFAEQAARNIQTSFAEFLFDPFKKGLNGMLASFVDTIRRMVAEMVAQQALLAFFSWAGGGATTGWRSAFTTMAGSIAGKAGGGAVSAGHPYMVGERGAELFVPRSSGTIVPAGAGGAVNVSYHIDARGADAERIMAILPGMLRQTEQRTISAVIALRRQGRLY